MKRFVCLFVFLFCLTKMFCEDLFSSSKILYEYDSPYYNQIYLACMEDGISLLSYKKPISISELYLNYKWINSNNLSKQGYALYNNLTNFFYKDTRAISKGLFGFNYNAKFALEARYLMNPDKEPFIDKIYRYNESKEPISLPLEMYISKYIYSYIIPVIEKNFSGFRLSHPYTNLPLAQNALDYHFPKNGGIAFGNKFFNIHIGRGRMNVGRNLNGSMLIADSLDRMDFISASTFLEWLKLDLTIAELSPTSFFITHAASIRPIKQISFTLHEGIILDSVFDPKFLNPFMIFHNYAAWKQPYTGHKHDEKSIGCQLGLDINIVPIKNIRIYGQFAFNQLQTPSELKGGANNIPNSMGGFVGFEYILPIFNGHLIFSTEFMYADPWLYIGYGGIGASFFTFRKENVYATSSYPKSRINYWIANPYGPDTISALLKIEFINIKKYNFKFSYRFLGKGENENNFFKEATKLEHESDPEKKIYYPSIYPKEKGIKMAQWKTPSGNASYFHTLKLSGSYNILKGLDLKSTLSWTIACGKIKGHSIDFSTAISYSIR